MLQSKLTQPCLEFLFASELILWRSSRLDLIQMVQFVYFLFVCFFLKLQPLCCCCRFSEKSCKWVRRCVVFLNKASAGMRTFFYGWEFKEIVQMNVWSRSKSNWPVILFLFAFFFAFFLLTCLI